MGANLKVTYPLLSAALEAYSTWKTRPSGEKVVHDKSYYKKEKVKKRRKKRKKKSKRKRKKKRRKL